MHLDFAPTSLAQTDALGRALAGVLQPGDTLALVGDLGAGKTTLIRAIANARGIDPALVSSPTFVIVNEYPGARDTDPPLVHVDAYRLTSADDLDPLGWDRLADGSSIMLIEWAERIADTLPPETTARLTLLATGQSSRAITLDAPDSWSSRPMMNQLTSLSQPPQDTQREPPREPTTCPTTGRPVPADSPTWPFANEQARMADLYKWFSGQHAISRSVEENDLEETE